MEIKNDTFGIKIHIDDEDIAEWDERVELETRRHFIYILMCDGTEYRIFTDTMEIVMVK